MTASSLSGVRVLGIRHHGPGSARSVLRALDELRPDHVIIEGPPELDAIAPFIARADMVPPVAALVYDVQEPRRAAFYPFAAFSPEWVALRWALQNDVPTSFADLPAAVELAEQPPDVVEHEHEHEDQDDDTAASDGHEVGLGTDAGPLIERGQDVRSDPIALLAEAAGYGDPERWWDDAVEGRGASPVEAFEQIAEAMSHVRAEHEDPRLLRREAAMRLVIRRVSTGGADRPVVVCGAYHVPALDPERFPTKRSDEALLASLPRTKVAATWAPWTNTRLALSSGYGAGVASPGWYEHLFAEPGDVVSSWLARVARALREEDIPASPAAVVEATRLAHTLAAVRSRPSAGLEEVADAALTVLCGGSPEPLRLIERTLVVGAPLGEVPDDVPTVPLAADLARQQRSLRLKPTAEVTTVDVDLRRPAQLARSVLLHRLTILGIDWGVPSRGRAGTGTFAESWQLTWRPELSVAVIVASLHGATVADAAAGAIAARAAATAELAELARLVEAALLADLGDGIQVVVRRLADRAATQHDTLALLEIVEPLARVRRYGSVRGTGTETVQDVLQTAVTRAAVGLSAACASLDDDAAVRMRTAIESAERGIRLLELPADDWSVALAALAEHVNVHGTVSGRAVRMLLDRGLIDHDVAATRMARRLSDAVHAPDGAAWLDGFIAGDLEVLMLDDRLRAITDEWLGTLDEAVFDDLLPLIRRTFAAFPSAERRRFGERLRRGGDLAVDFFDADRSLPAVRRMADLIGLEVTG